MVQDSDVPEFAKLRLFVQESLAPGRVIHLSPAASHYLATVMRRRLHDGLRLFNGRDGEWNATITGISKKTVEVSAGVQTRPQDAAPDVTLLFAPIKKGPMGFLVEKATELGVARLQPVMTQRTNGHVSADKLLAHAVEAAEQSWRLTVPTIGPLVALEVALNNWPPGAPLLFCDERGGSRPALDALKDARDLASPWGILIGPEGGFAPEEQARLEAFPGIVPVSLGPRIVRAETAAIMALTLWQSVLGDLG